MYYVFAGDNYYPAGGANDLVGFSEDLVEAIKIVAKGSWDWAHVYGADDTRGLVLEWSK